MFCCVHKINPWIPFGCKSCPSLLLKLPITIICFSCASSFLLSPAMLSLSLSLSYYTLSLSYYTLSLLLYLVSLLLYFVSLLLYFVSLTIPCLSLTILCLSYYTLSLSSIAIFPWTLHTYEHETLCILMLHKIHH